MASIREHAAIGDGRSVALVARDGTIDWWCVPNLDSPSVFGSLLDPRAGRFTLKPEGDAEIARRYRSGTNVLETTFRTTAGSLRLTDTLTLPSQGLGPMRELVRRVDGLAGRVRLRASLEPRFGYGTGPTTWRTGTEVVTASAGASAVGLCAWDVGALAVDGGAVSAAFELDAGRSATLALVAAHQEPLVLPARGDVERRLEETAAFWQGWSRSLAYRGRWQDEVVRSALALKLLVYAPSGAMAAAATTSLPESLGGERNWDYRFCWVRDSAFVLDSLFSLGCAEEAEGFFWWLMHASQITRPRLQVLYRLDGGAEAPERILPLAGYAGSAPVRVGNGAVAQTQLDIYGDLLHSASLYVDARHRLDRDFGRRLAATADLVCRSWRARDAGLWEVRSEPQHFTESKMMCWLALERAVELARRGHLPWGSCARWERERDEVRAFIEQRCWSDRKQSYTRAADSEDLDAGVLLGLLQGYVGDARRWAGTLDAVQRELRHGPFVYRYTGADGLAGSEGAFLACSFWLAEALARVGRCDAAASLMSELVGLANDVGLFAEEIDPHTADFLGNFPQALTHLSLISAANAISALGRP